MRRLQRNNDELLEQVENLRTQVDHLQARYGLFLCVSGFCDNPLHILVNADES